MPNEKFLAVSFLIIFIIAIGCTSNGKITGKAAETEENVVTEENVYDDVNKIADEQLYVNHTQELVENQSYLTVESTVEQQNETVNSTNNITEAEINESLPIIQQLDNKTKEFEFSPNSLVGTHSNISLSLDNIEHEIKSEYWGKITGITTTVLNKGNKTFKPKVLVILYDEKDFKEEWFKPKAEIEFDIDKLNIGDHITKDAIINIAFDDINLTKNFKLILVDAVDIGNKAIVVVEKEFNARFG